MELLPVGTRVKLSYAALKSSHDYWLSQGQPTAKARAKKWYDDKRALRGTIVWAGHNGYANGYEIKWDDGTISKTVTYFVERSENA